MLGARIAGKRWDGQGTASGYGMMRSVTREASWMLRMSGSFYAAYAAGAGNDTLTRKPPPLATA